MVYIPSDITNIILSYGNTFENYKSLRATCRAFQRGCDENPPTKRVTGRRVEYDITPIGNKHGLCIYGLNSHIPEWSYCYVVLISKYKRGKIVKSVEVMGDTVNVAWSIASGMLIYSSCSEKKIQFDDISDPYDFIQYKTLRVNILV